MLRKEIADPSTIHTALDPAHTVPATPPNWQPLYCTLHTEIELQDLLHVKT